MNLLEALRDDFWDVADLLTTTEGRRVLTQHDPLLFAYVYLKHHITAPDGSMTVCDFHLDLLNYASDWTKPIGRRKETRACFIAPRNSGKSTWIFLLLPMWAAAHGHRKFVAAFSDSEQQALTHLHTFKTELDTNELLRNDFPELCDPFRGSNQARTMMDNRSQTKRANGFIFMAKGADSAALGMKVGEQRPDVLLFDDIEPGESNYSAHEAGKRKETLLADLFPLNDWAAVGIVGTTTMPNSLIDQMRKVKSAEEDYQEESELKRTDDPDFEPVPFREYLEPDLRWVVDEHISVHYWPVIQNAGTDNEESLWPERWSMDDLNADRHTRAFQKNMMNKPVSADGGYWDESDIDIDQPEFYKRTLISVDPAVTTKKTSDYTGIAVVSEGNDGKLYVRYAEQVKMSSDALGDHVASIVERYQCGILVIETNQGGDLWKQVFKNVPAKYSAIRAKEKKEVRASQAVDFYKKGQVKHTAHFHIAEEQMLAFPHVTHDDVVDAIVTGVMAFKKARNAVRVAQTNYTKGLN